jgi:hypothetical protein
MAFPGETSEPRPPFLQRVSDRQWKAIDTVVSLLLFAAGLASLLPNGHHGHLPGHFAILIIALCLATFPLAYRRRFPLPVLVMVGTGVFVGTLLKQDLAGTPIVALAIFRVATQLPRRSSLVAACVTLVALFIALAIAGIHFSHGGSAASFDTVDNALAIAVAWFIGDSLRARRAYVAGSALQA